MHTRAGTLALPLLAALAVSGGSVATADLTADELRAARQRLVRYDVHGGTAAVLTDLTAFMRNAEGADLREARFLRAAVAADMVLLSQGGGAPGLRADVARAVGVSEAELVEWVDTELSRVSFGVYQPVAEEARWVLRVIESTEADPTALHDGQGERRDMLYVHAVVDALGREEDIERLGELGVDPCADGAADCPLGMFAPSGRRAVDALREANEALSRLEELADSGEPLVGSMAAIVAADGALLRTTEIHPTPRFDEALGVHGVGARGQPSHPELLVLVEPTRVRYTYVPAVRVEGRHVRVVAAREPALPHWASFEVRDDHRAAVVPYDDVHGHFAALQATQPHGSVGVAARAEVSGLMMSRILVSLQRAGLPAPELVSRGLDNEARAVHVRVVDETEERSPTALYVRLGGYSLHRQGRLIDLPRVRDAEGLHFDLAQLEARASAGASEPAALRYMSSIEWGHVLDAAFHLRPDPRAELRLQIR